MAFGLTTSSSSYTVNTGAQVTFSISRTAGSGSIGDLTSMKYNGTELESPFATSSRYSHYESGLGSGTVVTATVDPANQWILISCNDSTGYGVTQYYLARNGYNNIYMATYAPGPASPSPGEMRFITYTNGSVLTNIPAPSNNSGSTGAIESSDIFGHPDGTTTSKYYGEYRAIDTQTYGVTGGGFGVFMNIGNRETSSGGPFFKDIDFQNNELYTYTFSGHSQTENFRPGLKGFYALQLTSGATPAAPDYSFIDTLGAGAYVSGYTGSSGRGLVVGKASGVSASVPVTVGLSNAADQYWATPNSSTGAYSITGVMPGTYTETIYQGELAVGTQTVTVTAGQTTACNITNTLYTPPVASTIFRIGTWDGTPLGFLNADKIGNMHPTDTRMSAWADVSGMTNFTVGTDADSSWPMAEWHAAQTAAPYVDVKNRITFTLTAAQAATALTLRIGLTRLDSGRPTISANNGLYNSPVPALTTQPTARGLTTGNWRGNNCIYSFNIPTSGLVTGTNTIDIYDTSGSTGTLYAGYHIYDAIDLVTTSSITNAPVVTTLAITPLNQTLPVNAHQTYTATAYDQFGNPMPANIDWTTTLGSIDDTGSYVAPTAAGNGTISATVGSVTTATNITAVVGTPPTVATPAAASPSPATGTTTTLSVLGSDDGGEANLTYTWSATGPALVSFSTNGTNATKSSVATFSQAGSYTFTVTMQDAQNLTTTSTVTVAVNRTLSGIVPASATMAAGTVQQITAADQFGQAMTGVTLNWSTTAGTITSNGVYTAPATGSSSATITGISGSFNKSSVVTIVSPIAWYKADQTAGPSLTDSSGNAKTGTLSGAYNFSSGAIGSAVHLTGGNAALPAGIVSTVADFTIAAWINIDTLANWARVFDFGTGTTKYMFLTPDAGTTNALRFAITTGGGAGEQQLNGPALTTGVWTHVAVTLTGNTGVLYVNGVAVATNAAMTLHPSSLSSTGNNYLGKSQFADPALLGSIDDFRIYSTGLSAAGIASLYNTTLHTPTIAIVSATPSPVTGTSTALSTLGSEQAGESNLNYNWSTTGPATVSFDSNATNAAKNVTATFTKAGVYTFTVTATDSLGVVATNSLSVTVNQTAVSLTLSPLPPAIASGNSQQFTAAGIDQFGNAITAPAVVWSATGGTISPSGLFIAGVNGGSYSVSATAGSILATVSGTVVPTNYSAAAGDGFYLRLAADHVTEQIWAGTPGAVGPAFGSPTYSILLSGLPTLVFGPGSSANGILTIDATNGSPIPSGGIQYDGGAGNDTLALRNTSGNNIVTVGSSTVTFGTGTISYSNLESITATLGTGINSLSQSAQPGNGASLTWTDPTSSDSLNITGGTFTFPALSSGAGNVILPLASVTIGSAGTLVVPTAVAHSDRYLFQPGGLSISAPSGRLDLGENDLDLRNGSAAMLVTVQALVTSGYNQGSWTGTGIVSSAAQSNPTHLTTLGVIQNNQSGSALFTGTNKFDGTVPGATDILVKYTYYGDLNLDGKVDGSDYSRIDNGYLSLLSPGLNGWLNGDLNYNGLIDGSDYTLIDNAFNMQTASFAATLAPTPMATPAGIISQSSAVYFDKAPSADMPASLSQQHSLVVDITPKTIFSASQIVQARPAWPLTSADYKTPIAHVPGHGRMDDLRDRFSIESIDPSLWSWR